MSTLPTIRIAILDLYEGQINEGMRCIREILGRYAKEHALRFDCKEFDVRSKCEVPDLSFDLYISSGGPGSPLSSEGSKWEHKWFEWAHKVEAYNADYSNTDKKHVLFICHSFQIATRYFKVARVTKRKSTAFGVFPVHMTDAGKEDQLFTHLHDPLYAVDSRDFQVIQPDHKKLEKMGGAVLAIEKERPHVPLERAIMAMRFNEYMVGTQFHPEADAPGVLYYLESEDKKPVVIENYGMEKWESMREQLNDPEKIVHTNAHVLPNFLDAAIKQ